MWFEIVLVFILIQIKNVSTFPEFGLYILDAIIPVTLSISAGENAVACHNNTQAVFETISLKESNDDSMILSNDSGELPYCMW